MARFPAPIPWRFLLVDLTRNPGAVIAALDPVASGRQVTQLLNRPYVATCVVPSDDIRVNHQIGGGDTNPVLQKLICALVCLRQDGANSSWSPQFAGPIFQIQDSATADIARTTINAWGCNKLWDAIPLYTDSIGTKVPQAGKVYTATAANVIFSDLITHSTGSRSADAVVARRASYIDWGVTLGGTSFWGGSIATGLASLDITFQLSSTLGDGIRQLIATGACDVLIKPIFDPVNRPGYLAEGSLVAVAGSDQPGAVFAWDMAPNSLTGLERLDDGLPGSLVNRLLYGVGQGAVNGQVTPVTSASASITKYGEMWDLQNLAGQPANAAVQALAELVIVLAQNGRTIVTLTPAPERGPVPISAYNLGDTVPVYASSRFRLPILGDRVRVVGIPFVITDDAVETVQQILTSADGGFA